MLKAIYEDLGVRKKGVKDKSIIEALTKAPQEARPPNNPTFQNDAPYAVQQADLLFLPDDNGYRYALTVIDTATRKGDAEPLKTKQPNAVVNAFKKIYSRGILKMPKILQVDDGSEFKGATTEYFHSNKVSIRRGKTGRHKQQALAEYLNYIIGKALLARQTAQEYKTGEVSREWVKYLRRIINVYNKHAKPQPIQFDKPPRCKGNACKLLDEGDEVYVALDHPKDITGKRLHDKWRSGDIRYDLTPKKIKTVIMRPDQPPMYLIEGINNTVYTRQELMPVNKKLQQPTEQAMNKWIVEKIIKRDPKKKPLHYIVKWKGYKDPTSEPAKTLREDIPEMVEEFERNRQNKK